MSVRPIRASDHAAINRLYRSVGWPERSAEGWRWLSAAPGAEGAPLGFVVVDEQDEPAAVVGNMIQRFHRGEAVLTGATGYSIVVPPARAGVSRSLIRAVLNQPGLFAAYTFNANARAAPLYKLFGMSPYPVQTPALKLSWAADRPAILAGKILRRLLGGLSAEEARRMGDRLVPRRALAPAPLRLPEGVAALRDLADASPYADYWRTLKAEGRLIADRSPAVMRWRMADPDQTQPPLLLAQVRDGRIEGVAMAMVAKVSVLEPPCLEIIDLTARADAPDAIERLAGALIANARALGCAKTRLSVTNPDLLDALGDLPPRARREGGWGHCHARIADPALAAEWRPTPFDGDFSICSRPVPPPRRRRATAPTQGGLAKA